MQRTRISVPKLAAWIGLGGLMAATATAELQAQQAAEPPPPWKQGQPRGIADSKLAPVAPPPLPTPADKLPLDKLKVKAGFKIEVYAAGVPNARTLRLGDKGTVFVSSRLQDKVHAIVEKDGKREVKVIASGLHRPNGIALHKGTLYIAELPRSPRSRRSRTISTTRRSRPSSWAICRRTSRTAGNISPSAPTRSSTSRSARPATSACPRSGTPRSIASVSTARALRSTRRASARSSAWTGIRP